MIDLTIVASQNGHPRCRSRFSAATLTLALLMASSIFGCTNCVQTRTKLKELGYSVEVHFTNTEDGYILALERIPYGRLNNVIGKPVLLLHGLMSSSYIFALNRSSLALVLSDAGFDVWLYNARDVGLSKVITNSYSNRRNYTHSWNYSFHEMGVYDLPACIDYILKTTNQENLDVLGYSLGGTILLVLLSENPDYNGKLKKAIMIAPAARFKAVHQPLDLIKLWSPFILEFLDMFDYFPYTIKPDIALKLLIKYCTENKKTMNHCKYLVNIANGVHTSVEDNMVLSVIESFPQPFSSRTIKHFVQGIASGEFRKYDYGPEINIIKYNSTVPPLYDLKKITAPVIIIHSLTDPITTSEDTLWLTYQLQNVIDVYSIKGILFGHLSYVLDIKSKELVTDYIVNKLKMNDK